MKYVVIALISTLVACSGGASSEAVDKAQVAFENLNKARVMLSSVNTVEDAQKIEADLSQIGLSYADAIKAMKSMDQADPETAQAMAKIAPKIAAEYQGMLLALNALQARNSKAAQVLLDELKSFKSKR